MHRACGPSPRRHALIVAFGVVEDGVELLGAEEERHELAGVVSRVHDHSAELDLHVELDVEREGEDCLAEVMVEPRELGEVGEVGVYVGAEALRAGVGVAGEALRERLHLEEEVALPQEPLGLLLVRQLEAAPSVFEVADLLDGADERQFPCCRPYPIVQRRVIEILS